MLCDDAGDRHDSGCFHGFPQRPDQRAAIAWTVLQADEDLFQSVAETAVSVPIAFDFDSIRIVICLAGNPRRDEQFSICVNRNDSFIMSSLFFL